MASRFGRRRAGRHSEYSDAHQLWDPVPNSLNELAQSAPWWTNKEAPQEEAHLVREQLKEMDEHVARLQGMLKSEQAKCSRLQLRCNQQDVELRRREQHSNRLKERLSQLPDRHRDRGPSIEVLNFPPGRRCRREESKKSFRSTANFRQEEAMCLMLERREAELREAMKLRHSLTTLLHALRVDMERTLSDVVNVQDETQTEVDGRLDQAEAALGDHVTGGVVQGWRHVQRRLCDILPEGLSGAGTDHDKLLAQLETELNQSQQLVRLQQQLLQDSLVSPIPSELADSYFLEEWGRLQLHWAELDHQRKTFERERQSFTDAAIRLSHERRDFEHQKASFLKQQYLCDSPVFKKGAQCSSRRDTSSLDFSIVGPTSVSGCLAITPSSAESGATGLNQGTVRVQSPSTPELYSVLNLSYNGGSGEVDHQPALWDSRANRMVHTPHAPNSDWSF
ncbi:afadin- and alpha-actinin-binding protein B [Cheilinus undulatus]|uniref:afadin- and alpha-actinin-binding protein B n=1 Tax=Cheilinus undulatus TaxID=241271 RepID=UPI001BD26A0C|nr:afadin- and alpha-actinin-binding protein B [Cheilinus undulatus]